MSRSYDAVVVGSGPNGLAAAITMARAGWSVLVIEANDRLGGGARSAELTLPGFVHDVCSAIHPLGAGSPFFRSLPLAEHGLEWIHPPVPLAHPFDDGTAALLERSFEATVQTLGPDGDAWRQLLEPFVQSAEAVFRDTLAPLRFPRRPVLLARLGLRTIWSAAHVAKNWFRGEKAKGLFAGCAGHAVLPLDAPLSAAVGIMLAIAGHAVGWPLPRGGSHCITEALASYLRTLGGDFDTARRITSLHELPKCRAIFFDVSPRTLLTICGRYFHSGYRRQLMRFRHGPASFKLDWALSGPIPWNAKECARAATVHLGGSFAEIAESESLVWQGRHSERPYVLVAQQSLFDTSRAPAGKHTGWAYCHVPNASTVDMTSCIEAQLERFAPGFGEMILARHVTTPVDFERGNANYVGGDISGGVMNMWQLFTRPSWQWRPYRTPIKGIYICSASTPPGAGVHGMCGYWAAQTALKEL
jgi:phytoene dehydrogenase-like protein